MKALRQGLIALATLATLGLAAATPAHSQQLITNGGFETDDFTGWTATANDLIIGNNSSYAHSGQHAAWFGAGNASLTDTLSQTVATTIGKSYIFSYWVYSGNNSNYGFTASFGGTQLFTTATTPLPTSSTSEPFTLYSFPVTATSTSSVVQFTGYNQISYDFLDDVSVVAAPEPSQYAAFGLGLVGLGGLALRARRRQSA
jgi:hypothetical protein